MKIVWTHHGGSRKKFLLTWDRVANPLTLLADIDDDVGVCSHHRLDTPLVFCDKMYLPLWEERKKVMDAVKHAVTKWTTSI
jgi:hypothetical protein